MLYTEDELLSGLNSMPNQFEYKRLTQSGEDERLGRILSQCFVSPPDSEITYLNRIGGEHFRTLYQGTTLVGGLACIPMGQWWGGKRVSMVGIASVGIAPEQRGSGAAVTLMQQTVLELYEQGTPISVLYPAVQRLYRKVGYEQAGSYCLWEVVPSTLSPTAPNLSIEPIALQQTEFFQSLQPRQAQQSNGHLDRHAALWSEILLTDKPESEQTARYAYSLGPVSASQGYVIFSQTRGDRGTHLRIHDWVALTPDAMVGLWTFLANHRSQIDLIRWQSAPIDLATLTFAEQTARQVSADRWMLRIVHLPRALEQRGYAAIARSELHLNIQDDLIADNNGRFILSVENGQGRVSRGGTGALQLQIDALAPLYAGLFSPSQLRRMGRLEGTTEAIALATQLFAGESPWLPDFF